MLSLKEHLTYNQANIVTETLDEGNGKSLYMKGIFIEGDVRNQNNRIYTKDEIHSAVKAINEKIKGGYSVLGEADHPDDLNINLDRVSHMITNMDVDGANGTPVANTGTSFVQSAGNTTIAGGSLPVELKASDTAVTYTLGGSVSSITGGELIIGIRMIDLGRFTEASNI